MILYFVRIGQETLMEDDLLDDEIESELAPIAVQLAYVQQVNVPSTTENNGKCEEICVFYIVWLLDI